MVADMIRSTQAYTVTQTSYMYAIGDNFTGTIDTYCGLLNQTLMLEWSIENLDTNATVDAGGFNWTGMNTYDQTQRYINSIGKPKRWKLQL